MSNAPDSLDLLLDRFKSDLREFIDSAVADERKKILDDIQRYVGIPKKETIILPAPSNDILIPIIEVEKPKVVSLSPGKACGFCIKRGELCKRHGGTEAAKYIPVKKEVDSDPRQRYCINCRKEPINRNIYRSDQFCSQVCGNRWGAVKSSRKKKGLELYSEDPVYEPSPDIRCTECDNDVGPRARHDNFCSVLCFKRHNDIKRIKKPAVIKDEQKEDEALSNRPLIEFVKRKSNTHDCAFCGKPTTKLYCTEHCRREDELLLSLSSKKNKSYDELLKENGLKKQKIFVSI